jgi:hypothetical protein
MWAIAKGQNPTKQNSTLLCDCNSQVVQWRGRAVVSELSGRENRSSFCNILYLLKQTMDKDNGHSITTQKRLAKITYQHIHKMMMYHFLAYAGLSWNRQGPNMQAKHTQTLANYKEPARRQTICWLCHVRSCHSERQQLSHLYRTCTLHIKQVSPKRAESHSPSGLTGDLVHHTIISICTADVAVLYTGNAAVIR